jgi:plasmid maintenance system antidote protein VapI
MGPDSECASAELPRQRLNILLEQGSEQGVTQNQLAAKAGLPPQYLSDIKCGRRPLSELVARRMSEVLNCNFEWLMGTSDLITAAKAATSSLWLPVFPHPIEGEPRTHPKWDGTAVDIAGAGAAQVALAKDPYILRFNNNDMERRLRRGDLILVSQTVNLGAEISIVRRGAKAYLARAQPDGTWRRVGDGTVLPTDCLVIGHCLAIIWAPLGQ